MGRVVVVTPNPAVDVTYRVARQVVGETVRVQEVHRRPGGKGLNVAGVLRALGRDVVAVQPLGGTTGAWVAERLAAEGVPSVVVDVAGETRTTVAVVDGAAHPTLYAEPGPALEPDDVRRLADVVTTACRPGDRLVVAGSVPPLAGPAAGDGGDPATAVVVALVAAGRGTGAAVVVDTSGPALLAACRAGADVVMPNAEEALAATGAGDLDAAVAALLRAGARQVVVSRGATGLTAVDRDGTTIAQRAVPGVTGDPTGAGDAATAGLCAALGDGASTAGALRWAALCGAAAVLRPVAGELDPADLPVLDARLPAAPPGTPALPVAGPTAPTGPTALTEEPLP